MNKKIIRCGVLMMVSLSSMCIGAATAVTKIKADLRKDYTIEVDGNTLSLKGQYPISYKGVTYIPLRLTGEALGKEISWDSDTKTIGIGSDTNTERTLYDLKLAKDGNHGSLTRQEDYTDGGDYAYYFNKIGPKSHLHGDEFMLNSKYSLLQGKIVAFNGDITFIIKDMDNKSTIYEETLSSGEVALFDADVTGVRRMSIGFRSESGNGSASFVDITLE